MGKTGGNGSSEDTPKSGSKTVGTSTEKCPTQVPEISVFVTDKDTRKNVAEALVTFEGPTAIENSKERSFKPLKTGKYTVSISFGEESEYATPPPQKVTIGTNGSEIVKFRVGPKAEHAGVRIDELEKWFIPGKEECAVSYTLSNPEEDVDAAELEVYASNYSKLKDWNSGLPEYEACDSALIYSCELA